MPGKEVNSSTQFLMLVPITTEAGNIIAVFLSKRSSLLQGLFFPFSFISFSYSNLTSTSMQEAKKFQLGRPEQNM